MKISVCLIVKDEELVLDRCLECVKKFSDEIIVVDTGSSDLTPDIARKYTDKVYEFAWVDDFSQARNFSFSKASCEYVMWMDADDVIEDCEVEKILRLKENLKADTYMLKYKTGEGFEFYRERILKRCLNPIWEGFIHECILPRGKIEYLDIVIEHKKVRVSDPKRNLKIYRKNIKNGVIFNSREQYYYSKELYYNGYFLQAIKNLKKYINMPDKFYPNEVDAYLTIGRCYHSLKRYKEGVSFLIDFLKKHLPTSEICYEIATMFLEQNFIKKSIFYYKMALNCENLEFEGGFVEKGYYYLYPLLQLTRLYYMIGDFEQAKKYHLLAKGEAPDNEIVRSNDKYFIKHAYIK